MSQGGPCHERKQVQYMLQTQKGCLVKGRKNHLYIVGGNMTLHVVPHQVSQEPLWLWQDVFFGAAVESFLSARLPPRQPLVHMTRRSSQNRSMGTHTKVSGRQETSHAFTATSIKVSLNVRYPVQRLLAIVKGRPIYAVVKGTARADSSANGRQMNSQDQQER